MSLLFETILIRKAEPVNLKYHEYRLNRARKYFWNAKPVELKKIMPLSDIDKGILYRCRIDYDEIIRNVTITPYISRNIKTLQTVISDDIDYSFKYCNRENLDQLFLRRGTADDILIIKNGMVTDTSIANIVFSTGKKYFTPAEPLLEGTQRRYLIDNGFIEELDIRMDDLNKFIGWQHINAMNPFDRSRFNPVFSILIC